MAHRSGQDRKKSDFWRRMIGRQPRSGMSVRAWCRKHALRESSFYWWRTQLARRDAEAMTLVPVRVTMDSPAADAQDVFAIHGVPSRIEIVWPDQRFVRVVGPVDRQALTDVLAVLTSTNGADPEMAAC